MSAHLIPIDIEHGEDRSFIVHRPTGRRWEIRAWSGEHDPALMVENPWSMARHRVKFNIDTVEVAEEANPPAKRSWARSMGLRKPAKG